MVLIYWKNSIKWRKYFYQFDNHWTIEIMSQFFELIIFSFTSFSISFVTFLLRNFTVKNRRLFLFTCLYFSRFVPCQRLSHAHKALELSFKLILYHKNCPNRGFYFILWSWNQLRFKSSFFPTVFFNSWIQLCL